MAQTRQHGEFGIDLDAPPEGHQARRRQPEPRLDEPEERTDIVISWADPRFLVPLALFLSAIFVIGMALRANAISTSQGSGIGAQELVNRVIAAEQRAGFSGFTVRADSGLIVLEGEAQSPTEAAAIGAVARSVEGVESVDNRLVIAGGALDQQVQSQPTVADSAAPAIDTETLMGRLSSSGDITFETSSAQLTAEGTASVNTVAEILLGFPGVRVEVHGHTDSDGESAENERLSQARAEAVVEALRLRGVDPSLLTPIGFGESEPIEPNITEAGRAKNRRIEFVVQP